MQKKELLKKLPKEYKNTIEKIIKEAKKIYNNNLISIFLAGSLPKGNCIPGWSDIDLYIVTDNLNLSLNQKFYKKISDNKIHIGTTFYTKKMIKNLCIDQKTKIAFYEYNNYDVNNILYGKLDIPNILYEEIIEFSKKTLFDLIQSVERELYDYEIDRKNLKSLIKKTTLLMKVYLNVEYNTFVFGYSNVMVAFKEKVGCNVNIEIEDIINNKDKNDLLANQIKEILCSIIEKG